MNTIITSQIDDGEVSFDVFSKLVENRIIFLQGIIDDRIAADTVATLLYMDSQDDSEKISLYINSEGGDIRSVFMIYDVMQMLHSPIETLCTGCAFDESALILAAGDNGLRVATKNSLICLSQLEHCGSPYNDLTNAEISFIQSKKENKMFVDALAKCIGKKQKLLMKDIEKNLYLSSKNALKYGIIDRVL